MDVYESTDQFHALEIKPENADMLAEWGIDATDEMSQGLWVVRYASMEMTVAILSEDDFVRMYRKVS